MPRVSADARVVKPDFGPKRPDPPPEMPERQREIWRETVASEAADHFASAALLAMLADYCAHREIVEKLGVMIEAFEPEWLAHKDGMDRYHKLLKMREGETRGSAHLATKLRLTNQSRMRQKSGDELSRSGLNKPPWET